MVFFNWETESELGTDGEIFKERVAALGDCRLRHFDGGTLRGSFEEKDYRFLGLGFHLALIPCRETKTSK